MLGLLAAVSGLSLALSPVKAAAQAGDPAAGKAQYVAKCGGCHSLDANRIGPLHRGVVGRRPGTAPGYAYSKAVRALSGVWTPARLDQWLQGPQKLAPGSKMFTTVDDAATRRNIISYLQSVSTAKTGA